MSLDFGPIIITDCNGETHQGVRPSLLPHSFRRVGLAFQGQPAVECRYPAGLVPTGFGAAINVSMDPQDPEDQTYRYRLTAIMPDGRMWQNLYDRTGQLVEEGWL